MAWLFDIPTDLTIFADGGTIGASCSETGGTWAFRVIDYGGSIVHEQRGAFRPQDIGLKSVMCTTSEALAIIEGLEWVRESYPLIPSLTIASDSGKVLRMFAIDAVSYASIVSLAVIRRLAKLRPWLRAISETPDVMIDPYPFRSDSQTELRFVQMGGHPKMWDFERGAKKSGRPVSSHNKWCDKAATAAGKALIAQHSGGR
jgi:hypothetical protein